MLNASSGFLSPILTSAKVSDVAEASDYIYNSRVRIFISYMIISFR